MAVPPQGSSAKALKEEALYSWRSESVSCDNPPAMMPRVRSALLFQPPQRDRGFAALVLADRLVPDGDAGDVPVPALEIERPGAIPAADFLIQLNVLLLAVAEVNLDAIQLDLRSVHAELD